MFPFSYIITFSFNMTGMIESIIANMQKKFKNAMTFLEIATQQSS